MSIPSRSQTGDSYIEDRQNRRNQVLEQFIREAKKKGQMTAVKLDKRLAMKLQQDEENHRR